MRDVRPFLLLLVDMRNMIEHPKPEKYVNTYDYRLRPSGEIELPSVEIVRPGKDLAVAPITGFMQHIFDELLTVSERLMAMLCAQNVQPFAGMRTELVELTAEQQRTPHVHFAYACEIDGELLPIG